MTENEIDAVKGALAGVLDGYRQKHSVLNQCFRTSHRLAEQVQRAIVDVLPHYEGSEIAVDIGNLYQDGKLLLDQELCEHYSVNLPPRGTVGRIGPEEYHAWLWFAGSIIDMTFLYSMAALMNNRDFDPEILFVSRNREMVPFKLAFEYVPYRRWSVAEIRARGHS